MMKRYIPLLALLLASLLYPQSKIDINDLVEVDGKMYKPLSDKLYSGIVYDSYTGTGEKKLEGFYRNGLKNGEWTWWNVFGGIDSTGNFRKGLFYGQWKFYHSNGQLKAIGNYRNGEGTNRDEYGLTAHGRHGKWTVWYENGQKQFEGTYKYGKEDGLVTSWYENGLKWTEGTFKDGIKDGLETWWYENGLKWTEGTYKNGIKDGLETWWYENGLKEGEGTFKDGIKDGLETWWYENGLKWTEGTYKYGKEDGKWTVWYENGQKEGEGTFKDGEEDGLWTSWYENGLKEGEGTFKDGELDGLWTSWYENGQKEIEGTVKDGKEDGKWTEWYENGQIKEEANFKDGELISEKCWDEDGNEYGCDESLTVEISSSSYDTYPAVWFSPSTGEIIAVETETPPETKYRFWIEPRDPEFNSRLKDTYGVKYIGNGSNYFDDTESIVNIGFSADLLDTGSLEVNNVFYFRTPEGDCLIQILNFQESENYLKFKWKKV
jgi:antitoxin component YwqK of YwqJK toxin-antitoxin module